MAPYESLGTLQIQSDLRQVMQGSLSMETASTRPPFLPFFNHFWPFFWQLLTFLSIFHKTEVQTVILRCWTGLYLNWFKSYDTKCKYIFLDLATHEMINGRFLTISSQFSAIYINIFHKTEVQTVILRCWICLNLNWFKSYDAKTQTGRLLIDERIRSSYLKALWLRPMILRPLTIGRVHWFNAE